MFVNIPKLDEMDETERAREIERILKDIVFKHNREREETEAKINGNGKAD